jgi:hypothetical protein
MKKRLGIAILLIVCILALPVCAFAGGKSKGGPPAHAPAHGYRAKYQYQYYAQANVYYDTTRRLYFYAEGGNWQASVSLPVDLKLRLGDHVTVEMDSDKPYLRN